MKKSKPAAVGISLLLASLHSAAMPRDPRSDSGDTQGSITKGHADDPSDLPRLVGYAIVVSFRQLLYVVFNGERGRGQRHQITVASLRKALIKAHLYYRPLYE